MMTLYPRGVYHVWLCNSTGRRLALVRDWTTLTYARSHPLSALGQMSLKCGPRYDRIADIASLLEVWRAPMPGMAMRHEGTFIVEKVEMAWGERTWAGDCVDKLLKFRIVDAVKDSPGANKSGPADNVAKAYVREGLSSLAADPARDFNQWFPFRVQPDYALAPSVSKDAARAYVLDTLQALAKSVAEDDVTPTWLSFEVAVTDHDTQFGVEFRTATRYRGLDRGLSSSSPLVLSEVNALAKVKRERDHSREVTRVIVGGAGGRAQRYTTTVRDDRRQDKAPWWRREAFADAGETTALAELEAKGQSKLREGRPIDRFTATLRPHPSIAYGINLDYGDLVGVEAYGRYWTCRVEGVTVTASPSDEKVDLRLEIVE